MMKDRSTLGTRRRSTRRRVGSAAVLALMGVAAALPAAVSAQAGGPGFTFRRPVASVTLRAGYAMASARSDIFDDLMAPLIVDRRDFDAPYVGGSLAIAVADRWDVAVDAGHAWSRTRVEWRDYVELDGSSIWQTVSFSTTPVTVGARYYVTGRGRGIGRFVWIPARVTPYVGAAVGLVRYRFAREGDFVDLDSEEIYSDRLESMGTTFTAHGQAGIEVGIARSVFLAGEARYQWGRADLDSSVYEGFEPIDLSGLRFTAGLGVRF